MTFKSRLSAVALEMEAVLDALLPPVSGPQSVVAEAMRYAALGGGKRLRPFLLIESARLFGRDDKSNDRGIWQAAAALECLHVYSLVHDDLPCMDDDDMRRGKPTVHKVYGEAMAVLAGDGLLTHAMQLMAGEVVHSDARVTLSLVRALAVAGGVSGMIGGQVMDISTDATDDSDRSEGFITELQQLKTGALISFACTAGATLADAGPDEVENLRAFARDLGLAFQIKDDILDVEGDATLIGKAVGKDAGLGKVTFVTILGLEGARERAAELGAAAKGRLAPYGKKADTLCDTVDFVLERAH